MATAEQRWVAVRKRAEAQWHVPLFFCLALRHLSSSTDCTDVVQPQMCGRASETKNNDGRDDASRVFDSPPAMTLVMLKFCISFKVKSTNRLAVTDKGSSSKCLTKDINIIDSLKTAATESYILNLQTKQIV